MNIENSIAVQKKRLRLEFRTKRLSMTADRRFEAHQNGFKTLSLLCLSYRYILSYANFNDEFDLVQLNRELAASGKLILPKVSNTVLTFFQVKNCSTDLSLSRWGILEPILGKCQEIDPLDISLAIVPGLAFDSFGHRLGYGKGYYDRFLERYPTCQSIGVGYKEQLFRSSLPTLSTDKALSCIHLF